ncbi:MAG: MBL fold metallo-hydrolase, partial [Candidatus Binatia bacterium]
MTQITEIAPDIYRISTFIPEGNLQFNQFLVRDEQPLLYHTGMKGLFPVVRDAVATLIDPSTIRWIGFSHFEADECGALTEWQTLAPEATAVCSFVGKIVSVDDVVARRPAQAMADGEVFSTGKYRFRMLLTPHVPHCWEASLLFEETHGTLLCSDLLHQNGDVEASTSGDVV